LWLALIALTAGGDRSEGAAPFPTAPRDTNRSDARNPVSIPRPGLATEEATSLTDKTGQRKAVQWQKAERTFCQTDQQIRKKLGQPLADIEFDRVPLGEVIRSLRKQQGVNIDVRWRALRNVGIDRNTPVTVERLVNVPFGAILETILESVADEAGQLGYAVDRGMITISAKEDLNRTVVTRRYDVKDLLQDIPDFSGATEVRRAGQGVRSTP
jgi:hypothetical protein